MLLLFFVFSLCFFSSQAGIPGDWYSNQALLEALGRAGKWEQAAATFEAKKRASLQPPEQSCYTIMLRVCERAGFSSLVRALRDALFFGFVSPRSCLAAFRFVALRCASFRFVARRSAAFRFDVFRFVSSF